MTRNYKASIYLVLIIFACIAIGVIFARQDSGYTAGSAGKRLNIAQLDQRPGGSPTMHTFHVSPSGDNSNIGSVSQPWRTIGHANQELQAGQTVLIHAGNYLDQIRPVNNGSSNTARITYQAYGDGYVDFTEPSAYPSIHAGTGALSLDHRSYVTVSGAAPGDSSGTRWIRLIPDTIISLGAMFGGACGGMYTIVENIYMEADEPGINNVGRGWHYCPQYWAEEENTVSAYNIFRNNHLIGSHDVAGGTPSGTPPFSTEDIVVLAGQAQFNLLENNIIEHATHDAIYCQKPEVHNNILRGNTIRNQYHTGLSLYGCGGNWLLERNTFSAVGNVDFPEGVGGTAGNAIQHASSDDIVRYNLLYDGGATNNGDPKTGALGANTNGPALNSKFYSNSFVRNNGAGVARVSFRDEPTGGHSFVNNIVYHSIDNDIDFMPVKYRLYSAFVAPDVWRSNFVGDLGNDPSAIVMEVDDGGGFMNVSDAHGFSNSLVSFTDVLGGDPGFTNYNAGDYSLRSDSQLVDAGTYLTSVAQDDEGETVLKVEDSRFFQAGLNIPTVQDDWIAIGPTLEGSVKVQIVSVNDDENTLTLTYDAPRQPGDFVWLWKDSTGTEVIKGNGPDIGAFESPHSATCTNPDQDGDGFDGQACGGTDCDDGDPSINTGAAESCDGVDNDCNGNVDEGCGEPDVGLVAYYPFDNDMNDAQGNHDGTCTACPASVPGRVGNAYLFDGIDDRIEVAHAADLTFSATDSFTISAWIDLPVIQTGFRGIITKARDQPPWYGLWTSNYSGPASWTFGSPGGDLNGLAVSPGLHHVVLVQDGALRHIHIDGSLTASGPAYPADGTGDLWFGGAKSTSEYFSGTIDEVRIHSRALTNDEIASLYHSSTESIPETKSKKSKK